MSTSAQVKNFQLGISIEALMLSCAERVHVREQTLDSFRLSDWRSSPTVVIDNAPGAPGVRRISLAWKKLISRAASSAADVVLLTEDDIEVNRWLRHNLENWRPLANAKSGWFFGSLYNPHIQKIRDDPARAFFWANPKLAWGAQALLMSPKTAQLVHEQWHNHNGHPDKIMPRIASAKAPVVYHVPSLVDHRPVASTWGSGQHRAIDFDAAWRAPYAFRRSLTEAGLSVVARDGHT